MSWYCIGTNGCQKKNSWPELPAKTLIVAVPLTLGDGLVSAIPASGTIRCATVTIRVHHAPAS
eukprot:8744939-Pyramimonas_sp.AAC.1